LSDEIILVPSGNGLGHARRLVGIYNQLQLMNIRTTILLSERQHRLCSNEILNSKAGEVLTSNFKIGLDGPFTDSTSSPPNKNLLNRISAAKTILSDNVLWPTSFNDNVFLHGHFSWVDYWTLSREVAPVDLQLEKIDSQLRKLRGWFRTDFFSFPTTRISVPQFPMPLIRYGNDDKFPEYERRWDEIWVSVGTTGDRHFSKSDLLEDLRGRYTVKNLETFEFHSTRSLPSMVIGRPGVGTLRDCLSSNTLFLSNFEKSQDPELRNNWAVMKNNGLTCPTLDVSIEEAKNKSDTYKQLWPLISAPIDDYVSRMLSVVSEVGS
jgi:hypothetical protein